MNPDMCTFCGCHGYRSSQSSQESLEQEMEEEVAELTGPDSTPASVVYDHLSQLSGEKCKPVNYIYKYTYPSNRYCFTGIISPQTFH